MADALSKADFAQFRSIAGSQFDREPGRIPSTVLRWCAKPAVDDDLGQRILKELAKTSPILGYD